MTTKVSRRTCPSCGTSEEIDDEAPLWPAAWCCRSCGFAASSRDGLVRLAPDLDDVDEGFALASYESLPEMESHHFWFRTRNEMIGWLVRRFAPNARRVLEIGCGTGYVLFALRDALPRARIAGSELHSLGLAHARRRHGETIELVQMDARYSGLVDALDLVGAFDVLEHILDDELVLGEIHRMLKPGGVLIATVPQHPWLWSVVDEAAHHRRRYKVGELATKARAAGFLVGYESSFASLALPLLALDRWRMRQWTNVPYMEKSIPSWINAVLTATFRLEHFLRRIGVPLPIGGSQVLVANKPHVPA